MKKTIKMKRQLATMLAAMMVLNGSFAVGAGAWAEELESTDQQTVSVESSQLTEPAAAEKETAPAVEEVKNEAQEASAPAEKAGVENTAAPKAEENKKEEATATESVPEEAEAVKRTDPVKVKYNVYAKDASGEYARLSGGTRTIKEGGKGLLASVSSIKTKEITVDGTTYVFNNSWQDSSGNTYGATAYMSYDQAIAIAGDAAQIEVSVYAQYRTKHADISLTWIYDDVRKTNGTVTSFQKTQTVSDGNGTSLSKKTMESATGLRAGQVFKYGGYKYTYTGTWTDEAGNIIDDSTKITFYNKDGADDANTRYLSENTVLVFKPVYETTILQGLDFYYNDQISTGTGSWSNSNSDGVRSDFSSMTHTFSNPEIKTPVDHYRFVYWQDRESGKTYADGEKYTFKVDASLPEGAVTTVNIDAWWQPSVTVNYIVDGDIAYTEESFEEDLAVHYTAQEQSGMTFDGWYDEDGNLVSEDMIFELPEITTDGQPAVYNLIAKYSVIPEEEDEQIDEIIPDDQKDDSTENEDTNESRQTALTIAGQTPLSGGQLPTIGKTETLSGAKAPLAAYTPTVIENAEKPLASAGAGNWALINLLAAIGTGLMSLLLLIGVIGKKEEDQEDESEDAKINRKKGVRVLSLIPTLTAVIAFILTEDMSLKMALTDRWTLAMLIILAIQIVIALLAKTKKEEKESEEAQKVTA